MFDKAETILRSGQANLAVSLGDLVDDWGQETNIGLYERTLKRAIKFYEDLPDTLWCLGNHCQGYRLPAYGPRESGHSVIAGPFVRPLLEQLPQQVLHIVDGVIFTHAGLTQGWVDRQRILTGAKEFLSDEELLRLVNYAAPEELWREDGPIWVRPQRKNSPPLYPAKLQVVGHTPVKTASEENGLLSTDTFSTYKNGIPYGDRRFVIVDTEQGTWEYAKEE